MTIWIEINIVALSFEMYQIYWSLAMCKFMAENWMNVRKHPEILSDLAKKSSFMHRHIIVILISGRNVHPNSHKHAHRFMHEMYICT